MFDDLATYYHENVVASFVAYRDTSSDRIAGRSRDLREALIAASALFHLREHLPSGSGLTRAQVEQLCPDYGLLGDIVNAAKHRYLHKGTPHGDPLIKDAGSLGELIVVTEYEDELGTYRYTQKTVVVTLADGTDRNLLEVLTKVINFWESHLFSMGVLQKARTFQYDGDIRFRSRAECEASELDFEIQRGVRFHQKLRLMRFDTKTGQAAPIDLSGMQARMKIYQPKYEVGVSLTHDATGKEYTTTIALSNDESVTFARIRSDAERQAFVESLPSARAALEKLAIEAGLIGKEPD